LHPARLTSLAYYLLRDEAISGRLIIGAVIFALVAANSPIRDSYQAILDTKLSVGLGSWAISMDLQHWISDALMAFFFLVVGLELSRELDKGELKERRTAALPMAAALGGMLIPALIYVALNAGSGSIRGWAIPTATDIALAIGILALLGRRIPSSIRIFLLTLAIVDDVLAVIIIAVFYSTGIKMPMLLLGLAITILLYVLKNLRSITLPIFVLAGIILWIVVYLSGIHASITGAVIGLLAPLALSNSNDKSIAERVERAVIPFTTFIVVPLFAFANTGILISLNSFESESAFKIAGGIIVGLVVGKVLGIVGATWLMVKLGISSLPARSTWNQIIGVSMLAGIGFTVSIFVTELAFTNEDYISVSKISIFIASALSALIGYVSLRFLNPKTGEIDIEINSK
jgi:Na+:H+ antiporter, NhaA family